MGGVLSGCSHHKNLPVATAHVGELVYVNNESWPICSSIGTIQEFEGKIRSGEIIFAALADMNGSCQSTSKTSPVKIVGMTLVQEEGRKEYFYSVHIPDGISGWTTDKLWSKKNGKKTE